jgi:biopolymer transport protein ExbD
MRRSTGAPHLIRWTGLTLIFIGLALLMRWIWKTASVSDDEWEQWLLDTALCQVLAVAGAFLMILATIWERQESWSEWPRVYNLTGPGPQPRGWQFDPQEPTPPATRKRFRPPLTVWLGVPLALAGSLAYYSMDPEHLAWRYSYAAGLLLLWLCLSLAGAGIGLVVIAGTDGWHAPPAPVAPRLHPGTTAGHDRWKPKPSHAPAISAISSYALMTGIVLAVLLMISLLISPVTPTGLAVHLLRPDVPLHATTGLEALWVRVESTGRGKVPDLYLNGRAISWEDLPGALRKELNRRPPRFPVYVEGDPDGEWKDVVKAIDLIRGLKAEVILLTRKPVESAP